MTTKADSIPSRFDFSTVQPRIYKMWMDRGLFHAEPDPAREPYTIVIPPPNVTGALHLGHALNNTLQDVVIRLKRMQGFNTLWLPGTDHAGIATQAVVERRLKEEENLTRHDLGREELVKRIWAWKEQYEARILSQLQQMGFSCDWDRTRFTLDEVCASAVRHTFFDLFTKQLIYRGKRLVNWDTFLQTAVSDDEVFSKQVKGHFWHIRYPIIDPKPGEPEFIEVATTRPETMLGDTAVAVHPDPAGALSKVANELKARFSKAGPSERESIQTQIEALEDRRSRMLGSLELLRDMANDRRQVMLPLMDREIPLVTDTWAKPELGSGCVKITPAHDPNDYEVAKRCELPMISILNSDGTLNVEAGPYSGLVAKKARHQVVQDLDDLGLLGDVEDRDIELPHSDRSKTPIEPMLADQWFVRMEELAQSAMDAVTDGSVTIHPGRYERGYLDWLGEKRDWPVSRQLWWGHQIPVWSFACQTEDECEQKIAEIKAVEGFDIEKASIQIEPSSETNDAKRKQMNLPLATIHICIQGESDELEQRLTDIGMVREADVLDTWFSSALWPHSTLGWPEQTPELEYFYPTSTLITSRDIITLWVARMVLMGLNNVGAVPFKDVFIHPKILDGYGETMSKSKGNGIDPLDIIDKFGTDALRFAMTHLTTETQDVRLAVQFECPHCDKSIDQTKKNRELPRIQCPGCDKEFATQWAQSEGDLALPRAAVLSEKFETARNFVNKLWNASRFTMMNLEDYSAAPLNESMLTTEDRWMLSRLTTVASSVVEKLDQFKYSDATRELYDFAWDHFCSFYVEMLKDRLADEKGRAHAQRMLAYSLDTLLRLLHPIMPFVTEEIWRQLSLFAPDRGLLATESANEFLITASWPQLDDKWRDPEIETQFAQFQMVLGALREIRARQNIGQRKDVCFSIRCDDDTRDLLRPMTANFASMAAAQLTEIGSSISPPKTNATVVLSDMEIYVDLTGLIDVGAEIKRLEKEMANVEKQISAKENKLSNENFIAKAKQEIVERERAGLVQLKEQLETIKDALTGLNSQA